MKNNQEKFDVAVIGGGPAGMMAAGRAAEKGASVVLLEKNESLGKKLLITGKGRCNLTRDEFDLKELVSQFGKNGKFLFSSLAEFGPADVMKFFEDRKLPIENGKRRAGFSGEQQIIRCFAGDGGIFEKKQSEDHVRQSEIVGFESDGKKIKGVKFKHEKGKPGRKIVSADRFILCTGGKSYPLTGSTGDGYQWAKDLGHSIITPAPALVPIKTKEAWVERRAGLELEKRGDKFDPEQQETRFKIWGNAFHTFWLEWTNRARHQQKDWGTRGERRS